MADRIAFELVSPERLVLSRAVDMVVVPGEEGDFGALPDHSPFITAVRPGLIEVYDGAAVVERLFVAGGFAEVTPERCTVLAEEAHRVGELDRAAVEGRLRAAERAVEDAETEDELARAEAERAVARALLEAVGRGG